MKSYIAIRQNSHFNFTRYVMGSISIRGVDDQLAARLKQKAATAQKSVNQLVLDVLRTNVGLEKEKLFTKEYHDLDHLFGKWTQDELVTIQGKIENERQIDEELWK